MMPGEYILSKEDVIINAGKKEITIEVTNIGKRPVQIGSHIHFFEVNCRLNFDREKAYGKRLDIPSGTAVRFEAGETKSVELIDISGRRKVIGANGLTQGYLDENKSVALSRVKTFKEVK